MIDQESDEELGDYDFFEKYDEKGQTVSNRPKNLGDTRHYPFTYNETNKNFEPNLLRTMNIEHVGEHSGWVKAKLDMQQSLSSPAKHSRYVNNQITEVEKRSSTEKVSL